MERGIPQRKEREMNLTNNETNVLDKLVNGYDENDGMRDGWKLLYLDNYIDTSDKTVRGTLGSLAKKGLYEEEDGYAFGWAKVS